MDMSKATSEAIGSWAEPASDINSYAGNRLDVPSLKASTTRYDIASYLQDNSASSTLTDMDTCTIDTCRMAIRESPVLIAPMSVLPQFSFPLPPLLCPVSNGLIQFQNHTVDYKVLMESDRVSPYELRDTCVSPYNAQHTNEGTAETSQALNLMEEFWNACQAKLVGSSSSLLEPFSSTCQQCVEDLSASRNVIMVDEFGAVFDDLGFPSNSLQCLQSVPLPRPNIFERRQANYAPTYAFRNVTGNHFSHEQMQRQPKRGKFWTTVKDLMTRGRCTGADSEDDAFSDVWTDPLVISDEGRPSLDIRPLMKHERLLGMVEAGGHYFYVETALRRSPLRITMLSKRAYRSLPLPPLMV
ncbi:hypothetical protein SpCBS45565_g04280 [Spizellomyces sp. 'palustris']|nr:hypothetical protein SpCBS45565_g04280 [Spizellomyces sp. 'palustris']